MSHTTAHQQQQCNSVCLLPVLILSHRMRDVIMRPYGLKMASSSACAMFFGRPEMYRLAPLIASELGRAYETCQQKQIKNNYLLPEDNAFARHEQKNEFENWHYFDHFILDSKTIEGADSLFSIAGLLVINKSIAQTLSCSVNVFCESSTIKEWIDSIDVITYIPVYLSRISLQLSTVPMLAKMDRISSCVIVCGK